MTGVRYHVSRVSILREVNHSLSLNTPGGSGGGKPEGLFIPVDLTGIFSPA